jgi:hypothetical protein
VILDGDDLHAEAVDQRASTREADPRGILEPVATPRRAVPWLDRAGQVFNGNQLDLAGRTAARGIFEGPGREGLPLVRASSPPQLMMNGSRSGTRGPGAPGACTRPRRGPGLVEVLTRRRWLASQVEATQRCDDEALTNEARGLLLPWLADLRRFGFSASLQCSLVSSMCAQRTNVPEPGCRCLRGRFERRQESLIAGSQPSTQAVPRLRRSTQWRKGRPRGPAGRGREEVGRPGYLGVSGF